MRLTRIELENFKGVGKRQAIDLKPITLLFGANSAGKSTILHALHYLREILETGNCDPDRTIAGGEIDLGGFQSMVHEHDLERPIRIKIEAELDYVDLDEFFALRTLGISDGAFDLLPIKYLFGTQKDGVSEMSLVDQSFGLSFELQWSQQKHSAYLSKLTYEFNGKPLFEIKSPVDAGRAMLTDIRFEHAFFQPSDDETQSDEPEDWNSESPLRLELDEFIKVGRAETHISEPLQIGIPIASSSGALPDFSRGLSMNIKELEDHDEIDLLPRGVSLWDRKSLDPGDREAIEQFHARRRGLTSLFDELALGPLRTLREYLVETMTYIGPLREIPQRSFSPQSKIDQTRWATGLAAWDILYAPSRDDLREKVSSWLTDQNRLAAGYAVERRVIKEIEVPGLFDLFFERGLNPDDLEEIEDLYKKLSSRTEIGLRDAKSGHVLAPKDIGVGISQLIPVVVACLRPGYPGLIAIEQPELHIHPAIQVGLGDLFSEAINLDVDTSRALLIETHSEHLLLRLLRRIRETTEGEVPPGVQPLTTDDLSVVYIEGGERGTRFKQLRVSDDGDFLDRWPKGFFAERAGELF